MFNKSFDLTAYVSTLTLAVRKSVLMTLVGSVNAQIVTAADRVAQMLEGDGFDTKELEVEEVETLMSSTDGRGFDTFDDTRKLALVGNEWRAMLKHTTINAEERDELGEITGTLEMMTGTQRMRAADSKARELLKAAGVELSDADILAIRQGQRDLDQLRADARAKRAGLVEWVIDNMLSPASEDSDHYSQLPEDMKENLVNKAAASLNKAINTATKNVLMGSTRPDALGLGDIPILRDAHATLMLQAYPPATPVKPVKADAPGPKAKRVKKMSAADAQKLADSLHAIATT